MYHIPYTISCIDKWTDGHTYVCTYIYKVGNDMNMF